MTEEQTIAFESLQESPEALKLGKEFQRHLRETVLELCDSESKNGAQKKSGSSTTLSIQLKDLSIHEIEQALSIVAKKAGFDLSKMLGVGGMGAVAKARDISLGREVALKFVRHSDKSGQAEALLREAEQVSKFSHENIVQVYSIHHVGQVTFFAMELIDGEDLHERVNRLPQPRLRELLRTTAEALRGIKAAHDLNLIHRDIKPRNILISRDGKVKVADFGIASTLDELRSKGNGSISGTMGYMSPEQARGDAVEKTSDLYSLTATLFYALTKKTPIQSSQDLRTFLLQNQAGKFIPIEKYRPDLPSDVIQFINRNLNPDPNKRLWSTEHYQRELEALLLNIDEKELSPEQRRRPVPRWAFTSVCVTFAVILGGTVGYFSGAEITQNNTVPKRALSSGIDQLSTEQLNWLNSQIQAEPTNAALVILRSDLQLALTEKNIPKIFNAMTEIEKFRNGTAGRP